tara:strand:+ start:468 stop:587 length:120 start_codon:yes stop_codon:yes gene_type:complete
MDIYNDREKRMQADTHKGTREIYSRCDTSEAVNQNKLSR